jgi:glyoxylase-like metal-dependent hydrolase (beta-lactamase superfamily II)
MLALNSGAGAQPQLQPSTPRPEFDQVQIKATDLGNRLYMLEGEGGNIVVAVTDQGVIMVDDQFAPLHDKTKAAVARITNQPIRYLILTRFHRDNTGGNEAFAKDGATIVAQENVQARSRASQQERAYQECVGARARFCTAAPDLQGQDDGAAREPHGGAQTSGCHRDGDTTVYFPGGQCVGHRRHRDVRPLSQYRRTL